MNIKKVIATTLTIGALALTLTACGNQSKLDSAKELGPAEIMNQPEKTIWYSTSDTKSVSPTTSSIVYKIIIAKNGKMSIYDTNKPEEFLRLKDVANKSDKEVENLAKKYPHEERKIDFKLAMDGSGNNVKAEFLNNLVDKKGYVYPGSHALIHHQYAYPINDQKVLKATFSGLSKKNSTGADLLITKLPKSDQKITFDKPGTKNTEKLDE